MSAPGSPSKSSRSSLKKASEEEDPHPDEHALETADVGTATEDAGGEVTESGKFRQLLGILKKAINVKDLASIRLSLPATLMEPIGNLEYWMYADRPDVFAAIGESDDELERMLAVLRWTFTKDLKFVKHKIAKPFNSILGEHFRCHWEVTPSSLDSEGHPVIHQHVDTEPTPEVVAAAGRTAASSSTKTPSTATLPPAAIVDDDTPDTSTGTSLASTAATTADGAAPANDTTRVVFLNEQTSHHPPISFFQIESRGPKGTVIAVGADQLSAKFTGTTVKVYPGAHNFGIFVTLPDRGGEEYQVTHPTATIAGLLRGSPYVTIGEQCFVTCRPAPDAKGKKLRAIIGYTEESWLLKPKFLAEGVIYEYDDEDDVTQYTKAKHVPLDKVVATFEGNWRGEIRWKKAGDKTQKPLIDLLPLLVIPKNIPPISLQHELETQKVWEEVTKALHAKEYNNATKAKQAVEQAQRVKADERKKTGEEFLPRYFLPEPTSEEDDEWDGRPKLSVAGKEAIEVEFKAVHTHGPPPPLA